MVVPKYTFKLVCWEPKYDGVPGHWYGSADEWKASATSAVRYWDRVQAAGEFTPIMLRDNFSTGKHKTWKVEDRTWGVVVEQETENEYGEICP